MQNFPETSPLFYGLPSRVHLVELGENRIGIRKVIKSRIIQKDALKIVDIVTQIKSVNPNLELTLICTPNICSKSLNLLESEGIGVEFV
ncbi:MAG: hypothetical protein PHS59_01925 [Paludibacter sp.]|nr:hypothetical protein [Paludibacter sp.]